MLNSLFCTFWSEVTNSPFCMKDFFEKTSERLQLRVTQNSKGTTLQHVWVRFNNAVFICASFFQFRRFHQKTFEPFCLWKCNLYLQSSHVSVSDFPFVWRYRSELNNATLSRLRVIVRGRLSLQSLRRTEERGSDEYLHVHRLKWKRWGWFLL